MTNVYDIKFRNNLNFILPVKYRLEKERNKILQKKVAIFVHLYYLDTLDFYLRYLDEVSNDIDIFITYSDERVKKLILNSKTCKKIKLKMIEKRNRGRDISSLLVACRKYITDYEYICFLHDKKEKNELEREDTEKWVRCLWENMIGSAEYIENVLLTFYENPRLGILAPPFLMSEHIACLYDNDIWYRDFMLTQKLAIQMELQCDLEEGKVPLTLGTVFWARGCALNKLFEREWQYDDFDEEPLADDATISHAIERILPYVAQDAGYDTGWVMTDRYMGEYFDYMQGVLKKAFYRMRDSLGIWKVSELNEYEDRICAEKEFIQQYSKVYIYGAGRRGRRCLMVFLDVARVPEAFLVSDCRTNPESILGIQVLSLPGIILDDNTGIIVATDEKYREEILRMIEVHSPGFSNIYFA